MSNSRRANIKPFKRLNVTISDIDYDFDGMEEGEIEQAKSELPTGGDIDLCADELLDLGIVEKETKKNWVLNIDALEEYVSEHITSDTDFCHNGFNFRYSVSP